MPKIKVLSVKGFPEDALHSDMYGEKIPPVFNRDGIYSKGSECWIEMAGSARKYPLRLFYLRLNYLAHPALPPKEYFALKTLAQSHSLPARELSSIHQLYECYDRSRRYRETYLQFRRKQRRLTKKLAAVKLRYPSGYKTNGDKNDS
jgi:hypothetical protein